MDAGITPEHQKVVFALEKDEDGYPPMPTESLWCKRTGDGLARVDNIPFFATGVSLRDVVRVHDVDGASHFVEVVERAGHSTLRVMLLVDGKVALMRGNLAKLGCVLELSPLEALFSLDVPPETPYAPIVAYLTRMSAGSTLAFEEPCRQHP